MYGFILILIIKNTIAELIKASAKPALTCHHKCINTKTAITYTNLCKRFQFCLNLLCQFFVDVTARGKSRRKAAKPINIYGRFWMSAPNSANSNPRINTMYAIK